jgi:hypothetical protein
MGQGKQMHSSGRKYTSRLKSVNKKSNATGGLKTGSVSPLESPKTSPRPAKERLQPETSAPGKRAVGQPALKSQAKPPSDQELISQIMQELSEPGTSRVLETLAKSITGPTVKARQDKQHSLLMQAMGRALATKQENLALRIAAIVLHELPSGDRAKLDDFEARLLVDTLLFQPAEQVVFLKKISRLAQANGHTSLENNLQPQIAQSFRIHVQTALKSNSARTLRKQLAVLDHPAFKQDLHATLSELLVKNLSDGRSKKALLLAKELLAKMPTSDAQACKDFIDQVQFGLHQYSASEQGDIYAALAGLAQKQGHVALTQDLQALADDAVEIATENKIDEAIQTAIQTKSVKNLLLMLREFYPESTTSAKEHQLYWMLAAMDRCIINAPDLETVKQEMNVMTVVLTALLSKLGEEGQIDRYAEQFHAVLTRATEDAQWSFADCKKVLSTFQIAAGRAKIALTARLGEQFLLDEAFAKAAAGSNPAPVRRALDFLRGEGSDASQELRLFTLLNDCLARHLEQATDLKGSESKLRLMLGATRAQFVAFSQERDRTDMGELLYQTLEQGTRNWDKDERQKLRALVDAMFSGFIIYAQTSGQPG